MSIEVNCDYILLGSARTIEDQPTTPCIVVARKSVTKEILVSVDSDWHKGLPPSDREYVNELLRDWTSRRNQEADGLFRMLSDMSIGLLRFLRSGSCAEQALPKLLQKNES